MAGNRFDRLSVLSEGVIAHLRVPLFRNGYALTLSSILTAGLGMLYWVVASRLYSPEAVGTNAATIAAMTFLANIAMLSLMNALIKFIPPAGTSAGRLVLYSYFASGSLAVIAAVIFILGTPIWAPGLGFLRSFHLGAWFVISTAVWCVFVLQDGVLTGLRQAVWVPVENLIYSIAKLVALAALVTTIPLYGIFVSWTLPLVLVNLTLNWFIFRTLMARSNPPENAQSVPVSLGAVVKYVRGDSIGLMVWQATSAILPVIVLERQGAEAAGVFYITATIGYTLRLASDQMGLSLMAEGSRNPERLEEYTRRLIVQVSRLLLPVVVIILIAAPLGLSIFGESVAEEGATLLRLMALNALSNGVTSIYLCTIRVRGQLVQLVFLYMLMSASILSLTWILLGPLGITGVGVAWLVTEGTVAAILLMTKLRFLWIRPVSPVSREAS